MKKEYAKPYLAIESFQMDACLAGGCSIPIGFAEHDCSNVREGDAPEDIYVGMGCQDHGGINLFQQNPDICYHALARTTVYMES